MTPSTRIIVNTIAQYCRSVITMALAFVTTRVVFRGLGVVDFGIFSVVAGFVTMLGFITNALVISTQISMVADRKKKPEKSSSTVCLST